MFSQAVEKPFGFALVALLIAGGYPAVLAIPGPRVPMNPAGWLCFGILEVICLPFAAFFLCLSGPQTLSFSGDSRTYRYAFGWPFASQVWEGPWEDISGVYVLDRNRGRLSGYGVGIAWKDNRMRSRLLGMRSTLLGMFDGLGRLDRANRLAAEMAALLDVPLVEPPFPVRPSRRGS